VISAVGHEVDFTIADFVADVRAATPSNAAELVVERADHVRARIDRAAERLHRVLERAVTARLQRHDRLALRLQQWPVRVHLRDRDRQDLENRLARGLLARLGQARERFDAWRRRLERRDVRRVTADLRARTTKADSRLHAAAVARRHAVQRQVATLAARLDALSPLAVLGRGYAVCWNDARTGIIRSSAQVQAGERVRVTLAEGELGCRVEDTGKPS
jgi:exodeoxyribonuclease VII large subunit